MLKSTTASPKTTILGILGAIALCLPEFLKLFDGNPDTVFNVDMLWPALAALGLGVVARDHDVSSKKAGVETA